MEQHIKFPAIDLKKGDTIELDNDTLYEVLTVFKNQIQIKSKKSGETSFILKAGLVNLVSRSEKTNYFLFRKEVWALLKSQGVSRLPKADFLRPYYNSGAGPDECAANYLSMIESE